MNRIICFHFALVSFFRMFHFLKWSSYFHLLLEISSDIVEYSEYRPSVKVMMLLHMFNDSILTLKSFSVLDIQALNFQAMVVPKSLRKPIVSDNTGHCDELGLLVSVSGISCVYQARNALAFRPVSHIPLECRCAASQPQSHRWPIGTPNQKSPSRTLFDSANHLKSACPEITFWYRLPLKLVTSRFCKIVEAVAA
jgi:hypothetical protein